MRDALYHCRLNVGDDGCGFECDAEISEARLRALPFAVRCKPCEEGRERSRTATQQYPSASFTSEVAGF